MRSEGRIRLRCLASIQFDDCGSPSVAGFRADVYPVHGVYSIHSHPSARFLKSQPARSENNQPAVRNGESSATEVSGARCEPLGSRRISRK